MSSRNRQTSQLAIRITSAGMYSVLVDEIRIALGWARTRESERGLFGYTERGLDVRIPTRLTQPLSFGRGINGTSIYVKRERHLSKSMPRLNNSTDTL